MMIMMIVWVSRCVSEGVTGRIWSSGGSLFVGAWEFDYLYSLFDGFFLD